MRSGFPLLGWGDPGPAGWLPHRSDGLRTGLKACLGSRLALSLYDLSESNLTPLHPSLLEVKSTASLTRNETASGMKAHL